MGRSMENMGFERPEVTFEAPRGREMEGKQLDFRLVTGEHEGSQGTGGSKVGAFSHELLGSRQLRDRRP